MESTNAIAVIGFSAALPGCRRAEDLWNLVSTGRVGLRNWALEDLAGQVPDAFYRSDSFRPTGGGPEDFRSFDAAFFGYNPKEAAFLDPQIRKSLEHAWLALEHAGHAPRNVEAPVGVYATSSVNSYFLENLADVFQRRANVHEQTQILYLNEPDFLASRIAYHLDLKGPAFTVKCGCSSSMVAIHLACQALLAFECDLALAGGAAIKPRYQFGYIHEQDGILSENGKCCPFSADATGTVFANGVGFLVLKRYQEALDQGDTIHAVILGTAVNNDGNDKVGYMAPSIRGQVQAMQDALAFAGVQPGAVSYVEAHGTGTQVGDPIEFQGLMKVFGSLGRDSVALGSVKANIGHLDAVSGFAGLLKVILDLKHQTISPLANFSGPNHHLKVDASPFYFPAQLLPWTERPEGRIAAVSSFGVGGTNGSLIVQGHIERKPHGGEPKPARPRFIALSGRTVHSAAEQAKHLHQRLNEGEEPDLEDLEYTLLAGRTPFSQRWGILARSIQELRAGLNAFAPDQVTRADPGTVEHMGAPPWNDPEALATFWKAGGRVDPAALPGKRRIPLPGYAFATDEFWLEPGSKNEAVTEKLGDISKWFYTPGWRKQQIQPRPPLLQGRVILLLGKDGGFPRLFRQNLEDREANIIQVTEGRDYSRLSEHAFELAPGNEDHFLRLLTEMTREHIKPDWIIDFWSFGPSAGFEVSQDRGIYTHVAICKAMATLNLEVDHRTLILADQTAAITDCERTDPDKATLLGVAQVLPKEHEKAICHFIDIAPGVQPQLTVRAIFDEMGQDRGTEVALRGGARYVKDYFPFSWQKEQDPIGAPHPGKVVLVFGGLGNFGIELAEFFINECGGKVVLAGRTPLPPRAEWDDWIARHGELHTICEKLARLKSVDPDGQRLAVLQADVTRADDLRYALAWVKARYGRVDGVVHAAGTVDSGMIHTKTRDSLERVLAAKTLGTRLLCEVFLPERPDFIMLCSSMNAIIGGLGQLDNTAANAFVDAFSEHCHQHGHACVVSVNWGAVNEARARNYSSSPQFAELSREHVKNRMTREEAFEAYRRLFATPFGSRVVVSSLNFQQVVENWSRVGSLGALVKPLALAARRREGFVQVPMASPETPYEAALAKHWQDLLGVEQVGRNDNFFELGGNSLIAIQLIGILKDQFPIRMHAMSIYEYPTLREFAAYVSQLDLEAQDKGHLKT